MLRRTFANWLKMYPALAYLLAVLITALTTGLLLIARNDINTTLVALLYLLPVGLSSALWGLGPGALAALASFIAFNFFFIPPYYTLLVHHTQDLVVLLVFFGVSITIGQLVGRVRKNLSEATAREHEAYRMYELSTRLAGLRQEDEIVHTLAEHSQLSFWAERVDVLIEARTGSSPLYVSIDKREQPDDNVKPTLLMPLQSPAGYWGEIRLWRPSSPFTQAEERLLQTFANQSVLALERARLSQAASRARLLEESDRFKSSLLSSVSHELRTPLATIKAAVTSLRTETVPWDSEARADLLAVVEEETDNLNQLVGNLLNMSRIEAGALKPQRSWNLLAEIASSAIDRMRKQTQKHHLETDVSDDLPLVPVDYFQIEQVFINLISNSIKYSPEDTTVAIHARRLDGGMLQVTVSNQGPPVPAEHLERIFDKFYRVTAADRVTGAGLGLSICKGIVEAHGGRIWAENLALGFAFHFTLPLSWEGFHEGTRQELPEE